ncbi:MAG: hypothetical protein BVN35_02510 [Proteobacteria bacterium ST_bin11]|nr:MAG: hypothetical protein BVN35_02510 [Proteobacteria bacterium ST_bin11]
MSKLVLLLVDGAFFTLKTVLCQNNIFGIHRFVWWLLVIYNKYNWLCCCLVEERRVRFGGM